MTEQRPGKTSKKMVGIVGAGTELFTRFGIRRVTVEEICRKARTSKMTFYKYFPNKYELLKHIWSGWIRESYTKLDEMNRQNIPFQEKMRQLVRHKIELLSRMSPEFIDEIIHIHTDMKDFVKELRGKNIAFFVGFLEDAQEKGDMRKMRPEFVLKVIEKMQELVQDDDLLKLYPDYVEFVREVNDFFFFGIMPSGERERTE